MKRFEDYSDLLPLAVEWLESIQEKCLADGRALSDEELQDAVEVGVKNPSTIRVLTVEAVTRPTHPLLLQAAIETGLLGEDALARAVGYGIEIVEGQINRRLLRHEFRHVYQFEQAGSLSLFIEAYIKSVFATGYHDSEYEKDARAFEVYY